MGRWNDEALALVPCSSSRRREAKALCMLTKVVTVRMAHLPSGPAGNKLEMQQVEHPMLLVGLCDLNRVTVFFRPFRSLI
jgi:hypothetical protein